VCRHQLLLLADRVQEAEGVEPEPRHADHQQGEQRNDGASHQAQSVLPGSLGQDKEGEQQPGGDLDAHAGDQRAHREPSPRRRAGTEQERKRHEHDQQRVVVGTAHGQCQQHRVQPDEDRGCRGGAPERLRRARRQPNSGQA
jgi:hypothetical protein